MTGKIQILIIDDAEADREFISLELRERGFEVYEFYNPADFKAALNEKTSMVITDVRIPGYNVFEMIEYLKDNFPWVYIIVISGHFDDDDVYERLFELEVDRVVNKGTNEVWIGKVIKYVNQLLHKILKKRELNSLTNVT